MNVHAAEKLDVALGFWVAQQFSGFALAYWAAQRLTGFALAFGWRSGSAVCTRLLVGAAVHRVCTCLWVAQRFTAAISALFTEPALAAGVSAA